MNYLIILRYSNLFKYKIRLADNYEVNEDLNKKVINEIENNINILLKLVFLIIILFFHYSKNSILVIIISFRYLIPKFEIYCKSNYMFFSPFLEYNYPYNSCLLNLYHNKWQII